MIDRVRILREGTASWEPHSTRPATAQDLVDALIAEGVLTEERTGKMFPSETRKAILEYRDTERRFVTAWEPIPAEEETR